MPMMFGFSQHRRQQLEAELQRIAAEVPPFGALRLVLTGNIYVPPLLVSPAARAADNDVSDGPRSVAQLTDRQVDVLRYLRDGLSNKEISANLGIAEKTVKVHIAAIFKTLNVVNRTQAARFLRDAPDAP